MWRCRLHNGGAAIPPDVLPRVFEIFFSTKPGGTGIGLALCQRIIEEHGGIDLARERPGVRHVGHHPAPDRERVVRERATTSACVAPRGAA